MKICFVVRALTKGGVYRFVNNILSELDNINIQQEIYLIHDDNRLQNKFNHINEIYINTSKLVFDYISSFNFIRKHSFGVLIYPKNVIPLNHFLLNGKKVNIIHDLGYFEKKLNAYPLFDTLFMKSFMKISCKLSNKVLAVSSYTKNDIIKRFNINKNKINVIYEGVESKYTKHTKFNINKTLDKYKIKKPFLFYSGTISPRKNLHRTLKAFGFIKNIIPHDLVITGFAKWKSKHIDNIIKSSGDRIKIIGYVEENELIDLYNSADLYLYPSLYEGFGLPILEAQACGCPVLTSNVTSCPEVAGEGAHLVNPYSEFDIAESINRILHDECYKAELVRYGYQNLRRFSWVKTTKKLLEFINYV